ncbi:MAG: sel1 repeat family protein [Selenomonadaceae bacterium]|nr:sel1 repeat family protein [Selenomonadaceae bacterium]
MKGLSNLSEEFTRRVVSEKDVPPTIRKRIKKIQQKQEEQKALLDMTSDVLYLFDLKKKAEAGNVESQLDYADIYMYGLFGAAVDYETAAEYYTKAAQAGNVTAQTRLADCYFDGMGVAQNYSEAVKWYTKAARHGDAYAKTFLAICYQNGNGVEANMDTALKLYEEAARAGDALAQFNLSDYYLKDEDASDDEFFTGLKWLKKSAAQNFPPAQTSLGMFYIQGMGVEQNFDKGFELLNAAIAQDDVNALAFLGGLYYKGIGVRQDTNKGLRLLRQAAERGSEEAADMLARLK